MERVRKFRIISAVLSAFSLITGLISLTQSLSLLFSSCFSDAPVFADYSDLYLPIAVTNGLSLLLAALFLIHCVISFSKASFSVSFTLFALVYVAYCIFSLSSGLYFYGILCLAVCLFVAVDGIRGFRLITVSLIAQALLTAVGLVTALINFAVNMGFGTPFVSALPSFTAPALNGAVLVYLIYVMRAKRLSSR